MAIYFLFDLSIRTLETTDNIKGEAGLIYIISFSDFQTFNGIDFFVLACLIFGFEKINSSQIYTVKI